MRTFDLIKKKNQKFNPLGLHDLRKEDSGKKHVIFVAIITKTNRLSLQSPAFFKILKNPALVQKPTIPHMKALIFSYLEPEG
jgi:hypothetical protein